MTHSPGIAERLAAAVADRYHVERELGHGGMATVHLARDLRHDRLVAIKVLRPELAQAMGAERFLREIGIAARLQSPHILPLLDSGEADGVLFYVMPYVDGESLRARLAREGALPASEAMRLLRDVVDGLAHAHKHGVVHRDIKPDNVMLAERHAHLVDFGVAKALREASEQHDLTSIGVSLGTPAYMAPEQAAADPEIDHRADIYAVGCMAYEMLVGQPPFTGSPQVVLAAQITADPPPIEEVRRDVPPAIAQLVMRCLEKLPGDRYQTADELLQAIEGLHTPIGLAPATVPPSPARRTRRRALAALALVALGAVGWAATGRLRQDRWVHRVALPELARLVEAGEPDSAFTLALRIRAVTPDDSSLAALLSRFARLAVITSSPAGARVYRAALADTSQWHHVGTTPTDSVLLPQRAGLYRFEGPGLRTEHRVLGGASMRVLLDSVDAADADMVRVGGGDLRAFLVGTDGAERVELGDYRMDRYEVSNRQYKAFVDSGGYAKREYWEHALRDGARELSWEEGIARLVDRTGRPGPAGWEGGEYPAGQADHPVSGVSWYEAAAYAKFAGKSLPTIYHWARAATIQHAREIVPHSNLAARSTLPVGTPRGVAGSGVSDLAGNVREWCINEAGGGLRFILGGGFSDPTYAFVDAYAQQPLDRSPVNGIRLVRYAAGEANLARAARPIPRAFTDYASVAPVADAVFAGFLPQFDYDPLPLAPRLESRDSTPDDWTVERVSFAAAYGGERMAAWVFLPRRGTPPYQTVVVFPGSGTIGAGPSDGTLQERMSFIVRAGRALVYPVYKSTHERSDSLRSDIPDKSVFWRDHVVMWAKDYRRAVDYVATRPDLDSSRVAYFGFSWGGYMGGIIPAVEPRIKASVLYVAGFTMERGRPEVDPVHFLPRVRQPTLMLNGKHDFFFPVETSQRHFFRMLGSPAAEKKWVVYEGGHDVPRTQLISESLAWLDRYLGPVR